MNTGITRMSKNNKSVKVNFIMNAILNLSAVIFPLITFPYVSRILTPTGTGRVSSAVALVTYFAMVAQLGIPTYGIRACAIVRDDKEKLSRTAQEIFIIIFRGIVFYPGNGRGQDVVSHLQYNNCVQSYRNGVAV